MKRFTDIPINVTAGTHRITVTFIERSRAASDEQISTFSPTDSFSYTGAPRVPGIFGGIDMTGPYSPTGLSPTPSRRKLFVCEPEVPERERACAEQIGTDLARRAFRRPVDQADLDRLMPFYEEGRSGPGGFDEGIELMTTAVLASPDFLYRSIAPRDAAGGDSYELSAFELASRLSFFLWSQGPDDELLRPRCVGRARREPRVLDAQVERMLADPRAAVLVTNFALHWLNVDDLDAVQPDKLLFPEFTEGLRQDFAEEIERFVASVLLEDQNVRTLLTADYTFLNERLARQYGVEGVVGPQFRRVELDRRPAPRAARQGRGAAAYVVRRPNVAGAARRLGARQAARHAADAAAARRRDQLRRPKVRSRRRCARGSSSIARIRACNACHGVIDPYGLALENFTATGRWRDHDEAADAPIDASHEAARRQNRSTAPSSSRRRCSSAKTNSCRRYAQAHDVRVGRELEYFDMPQVRAVVHAAAREDYRFSAIVTGIVRSDAFRMQAAAAQRVRFSSGVLGGTGASASAE